MLKTAHLRLFLSLRVCWHRTINLWLVGSLFFLATSNLSEELELNPGPLILEVTYLAIRPGLFGELSKLSMLRLLQTKCSISKPWVLIKMNFFSSIEEAFLVIITNLRRLPDESTSLADICCLYLEQTRSCLVLNIVLSEKFILALSIQST